MRQKCPEFAKNKYLLNAWNTYFENKNSFIHAGIQIEGIPCFPHHEVGVFISKEAKIGKNAVIFQHVTIGSNTLKDSNFGAPIIGDNCYIGSGAKIIGKIVIGNNCRIGANACVYKDMPDNSVAVCAPTRIIQKNEIQDNRFYSIEGKYFDFEQGKYV